MKLLCAIGLFLIVTASMSNAISLGVLSDRMNVNRDLITLSGSSSGGTMAQQMYISYSSLFHGMATISDAFYRCGPGNGNETDFNYVCATSRRYDPKTSELYSPNKALIDIQSYFSLGLIEDPINLENKPFYIFAGSTSYRFPLQMGLGALQVFEPFINNRDVIQVRVQAANLTLPNDRRGLPDCGGPQNELKIGNCGFSAALESLQWIIGKKYVKAPSTSYNSKLQPLLEFDQREFFYGMLENVVDGPAMDSVGYIYIPKVCKKYGHTCLLHIYFHACSAGREFVGARHILNSGYLEVAETNGIIMLFPQAIRTIANPKGCWDVYGFTSGEFYATQLGAQVVVVKNMLDRILGPSDGYDEQYAEETTQKPSSKYPTYQVSSELLRSYDDKTAPLSATPTTDYQSNGRQCTTTRISPNTVLKRCQNRV